MFRLQNRQDSVNGKLDLSAIWEIDTQVASFDCERTQTWKRGELEIWQYGNYRNVQGAQSGE